jgi:membrane protease YdiL (CAAX protease family)
VKKGPSSPRWSSTTRLSETPDDIEGDGDEFYDSRTTLTLIGGQALLVPVAALLAALIGTPNFGFGPGVSFSTAALEQGAFWTIPLCALAVYLDVIEDQYPALQDVTKATQRSVLALLGASFKPLLALATAVALGLAAGFGEEMLFRGIFQYEVANRVGPLVGVASASVVFGLLHFATPLYAALAAIASVYFGLLYLLSDNLAVPIACHTVYDIGALLYAHWTVTQLTPDEIKALQLWKGPGDKGEAGVL